MGTAVDIENLSVRFGTTEVLRSVSMSVPSGRVVGLVGESGSGKSTLGKTLVGINPIASGKVRIGGRELGRVRRNDRLRLRRIVQMIPQDPYSSLSPRRTIGQTLAEAIDPRTANAEKYRDQIAAVLENVHLDADIQSRYPHEFSGGQRQRIAIARAMIVEPEVVVADEITSALDVSVQAKIIDLLAEWRARTNLTMIFISHNLAVVEKVCDDVVVLYRGDVVESGPIREVYRAPQEAYTRRLLASVPGAPGFSLAR